MKSYRVFIISLLAFFSVSLNAQYFVGGQIGFNTQSNKSDNGTTTSKTTTNTFSFYPSVGKYLSEKVAAGLNLNIALSGTTSGPNPDIKSKSSTLGAGIFLRYYAITWNKFSVFGQGDLGVAFTNSSETFDGTKTDGPKESTFALSIYPGLAYDLSDKLQLQTYLNILSLGFGYRISDDGSTKITNSRFFMGAGLDDIISIPTLSIGAIYKF